MRIAAAVKDALFAFAVCVLTAAVPAHAGSLTITAASFPHGVVNVDYPNPTLQATGGSGTLTWSVANGGTIPDNVHISASGVLFGRPDTVGTTTAFTIQVTDGSGQTATRSYTVVVDNLQTAWTIYLRTLPRTAPSERCWSGAWRRRPCSTMPATAPRRPVCETT